MKTPMILAAVMAATMLGACQKSTPPEAPGQSSVIDKPSAAPSLAGTPVEPIPAMHAGSRAAEPTPEPTPEPTTGPTKTNEQTARDNPATEPLADLTKEKESVSMPLAAHGNNHSSESLKGTDAPKQ